MSGVEQLAATNTNATWEFEPSTAVSIVEAGYLFDAFDDLRHRFFDEGRSILENGQRKLVLNDYDHVPLANDVLSTATEYVASGSIVAYQALVADSRRLVAEVERKNDHEYFPPIFQQWDPVSGTYTQNGKSIRTITENGISPLAASEEQQIRVTDYANERVNEVFGASMLPRKDLTILRIGECPDEVIDRYKKDPSASYGNYSPQVEKLVIEEFIFDESGRYYHQLALPGIYITHDLIVETLAEVEAIDEADTPTKLELRGKSFINQGEPTLIKVAALLDQKASEKSGLNIFLGEVVPIDHPKDYDQAMTEAVTRQAEQNETAQDVTDFLIGLAQEHTDSRLADLLLGDMLKKKMFDKAKSDPKIASSIFNQNTAEGIFKINQLIDLGRINEASRLEVDVFEAAPQTSYCGAGSCGLEKVSLFSEEAGEAKKLGLNEFDLLKDNVRVCPDCKKKTIIYELKTGSKGCTNCHKVEKKS